MSGNIVEHIQALGKAGVAALADTNSFQRGRAIDAMDMDALQFTGEEFYAQVMGTNPHLVKIWLGIDEGATVADRLSVHCTCPARAVWCKHVVAVALRIIADPEWATQAPGRTFPPVELSQEQVEKYGDGNSIAARVTMMITVQRTLEKMGRKEVLGVVDKLCAAHPEILPTLTAIVEPYMSEPSAGMLAVHDAVEEARYASNLAWTDHQVAKAADLWNVAVNTVASHYDSENAESMLSLLDLVIMDINELACRVAVPVDALVEVIERACDLHVRITEQAEPDPIILRDDLVEGYLAPGYIPTDLEKYAPLLGDGDVDELLEEARAKVPLHPERVLDLECDAAAVRGDLPRLKELTEHTATQDALYRYYDKHDMTAEAKELVCAVLAPDRPVKLSPRVRREAARKYLGERRGL